MQFSSVSLLYLPISNTLFALMEIGECVQSLLSDGLWCLMGKHFTFDIVCAQQLAGIFVHLHT